jgi:hypothetical protein
MKVSFASFKDKDNIGKLRSASTFGKWKLTLDIPKKERKKFILGWSQ